MDSTFTKIIKGEIPAYKIYEDGKTLAFLDIFPKAPGHVLVIPKAQIDKAYDLPDEYHDAVWRAVKKISSHMDKALNRRIFIKVIGTDVPHAHIHLIPQSENYSNEPEQADDKDLAEMAAKLKMM